MEPIRSFSWTDDGEQLNENLGFSRIQPCGNDGNVEAMLQGAKVKIYLQLPEGTLQDASQVTCDFQDRSFHLQAGKTFAISMLWMLECMAL